MSWKGFQKAVVRMPQLVKQKTGMADATTDADFDDLQVHFEASLKAVGRLAEDVKKYRAAMQQWTTLTGSSHPVDDDHQYPELEVIVAQLSEYHQVMKSVSQKITKRNHKLIDYDRHRNTIRSLQANKNRSVSEERSMIRAEEAFQQAQREYDEWNNLLKQELPVLLECQQEIVKPIYAQLLFVQKQFFSQAAASVNGVQVVDGKQRLRPTDIVIDYEERVRVFYERLNECQMTRVGGLSAASSRHPSSLSVNSNGNGYSNKPLPQPNITSSRKSIDQMVSEMQISTGSTKDTVEREQAREAREAREPEKPKKKTENETVKALYDFTAQQSGDLSFKAGDTINIVEKTEHRNDWWRGRTEDGREGIFPGNYVS